MLTGAENTVDRMISNSELSSLGLPITILYAFARRRVSNLQIPTKPKQGNLIAALDQCRISRRPAASIADLPSELLLIIFRLAYMQSRAPTTDMDADANADGSAVRRLFKTAWNPSDDLESPAIFPYALASVCRTWQHLMSGVPQYWTRVVWYVGDRANYDYDYEGAGLRTQLAWSRDRAFTLVITAQKDAHGNRNDDPERLQKALAVLLPHLSRCKALLVRLDFTSSLPSIVKDIYGAAPRLQRLLFSCERDSKECARVTWPEAVASRMLDCPKLNTLHLDGLNFLSLALTSPAWFRTLTQLRIGPYESRYRDNQGFPSTIFLTALSVMEYLDFLIIFNTDFSPLGDDFVPVRVPALTTLALEFLRGAALRTLFTGIDYSQMPSFHGVQIVNCELDDDVNEVQLPDCSVLSIDSIECWKDCAVPLISSFFGVSLTLKESPELTARILESMARRDPQTDRYGCSNVKELTIRDTSDLPVELLQKLVEERNTGEIQTGDDGLAVNPTGPITEHVILDLRVAGRVPTISADQEAWFQARVLDFEWTADDWEDDSLI